MLAFQPYDAVKACVYSIGVVLHAMVCEKLPYEFKDQSLVNALAVFPHNVTACFGMHLMEPPAKNVPE